MHLGRELTTVAATATATATAIATATATATGASSQTTYVGWQQPAKTRGSLDIIWSCLTVFILCSYKCLHRNIDKSYEAPKNRGSNHDKYFKRGLVNAKGWLTSGLYQVWEWVGIADEAVRMILVPELGLSIALHEYRMAYTTLFHVRGETAPWYTLAHQGYSQRVDWGLDIPAQRELSDSCALFGQPAKTIQWSSSDEEEAIRKNLSLAHSFYAQMGGFVRPAPTAAKEMLDGELMLPDTPEGIPGTFTAEMSLLGAVSQAGHEDISVAELEEMSSGEYPGTIPEATPATTATLEASPPVYSVYNLVTNTATRESWSATEARSEKYNQASTRNYTPLSLRYREYRSPCWHSSTGHQAFVSVSFHEYVMFLRAVPEDVRKRYTLSSKQIARFSKANTLAKFLAIWQALVFIMNLISRKVEKLPNSMIEVVAATYIISTLCIYLLWMKKPYNAEHVTVLHDFTPELSRKIDSLYEDARLNYELIDHLMVGSTIDSRRGTSDIYKQSVRVLRFFSYLNPNDNYLCPWVINLAPTVFIYVLLYFWSVSDSSLKAVKVWTDISIWIWCWPLMFMFILSPGLQLLGRYKPTAFAKCHSNHRIKKLTTVFLHTLAFCYCAFRYIIVLVAMGDFQEMPSTVYVRTNVTSMIPWIN